MANCILECDRSRDSMICDRGFITPVAELGTRLHRREGAVPRTDKRIATGDRFALLREGSLKASLTMLCPLFSA